MARFEINFMLSRGIIKSKEVEMLSLVLAILAILGACIAQTPIPYRPPGFVYHSSNSREMPVIEVFYDHLCPDSRDSWPTMKQVFAKYDNITAIIHIFPLPYHHNAYFVQQAGVVIRNTQKAMGSDFVHYMELVFSNQEKFVTGAVDMTEPQVQQMIAKFVADNISGFTTQAIMEGFTDDKVVTQARYAWKYDCSRGVSGTPFFMINGVIDPNAGSYSVDEWEKMIETLMAGPQAP